METNAIQPNFLTPVDSSGTSQINTGFINTEILKYNMTSHSASLLNEIASSPATSCAAVSAVGDSSPTINKYDIQAAGLMASINNLCGQVWVSGDPAYAWLQGQLTALSASKNLDSRYQTMVTSALNIAQSGQCDPYAWKKFWNPTDGSIPPFTSIKNDISTLIQNNPAALMIDQKDDDTMFAMSEIFFECSMSNDTATQALANSFFGFSTEDVPLNDAYIYYARFVANYLLNNIANPNPPMNPKCSLTYAIAYLFPKTNTTLPSALKFINALFAIGLEIDKEPSPTWPTDQGDPNTNSKYAHIAWNETLNP
ncbi:MAG: hypothetical protein HW387_804 [Parachlamydiales bacterium]|nr:hypothetical protein [Parachlamydiales bacterium]